MNHERRKEIVASLLLIASMAILFLVGGNREYLNPDQVFIHYERWGGMDCCPSYKVTIWGDGHFVFEGASAATGYLMPHEISKLIGKIEEIAFFELDGPYDSAVTDQPSYRISIQAQAESNEVKHYGQSAVPAGLFELEELIYALTDTDYHVRDYVSPGYGKWNLQYAVVNRVKRVYRGNSFEDGPVWIKFTGDGYYQSKPCHQNGFSGPPANTKCLHGSDGCYEIWTAYLLNDVGEFRSHGLSQGDSTCSDEFQPLYDAFDMATRIMITKTELFIYYPETEENHLVFTRANE